MRNIVYTPSDLRATFIIMMQGRLGNLMFEYALLLSLRAKYPGYKGYLYRDKNAPGKTGYIYELENIFKIPSSDFASDEMMEYVKALPLSCVRYVWEEKYACRPSIILDNSLVTICIGYWQTETAFDNVKEEVRNAFIFNTEILNVQTKQLAEKLKLQKAIALHVRHGDYLDSCNIAKYDNICTSNYYKEAVSLIHKQVGNELPIYCFSDDPEWVKSNLQFQNSYVVDWNQGDDSWQDMYLMSLCHHNIIANSTFSWWGAWLNPNKDKIVVAPYRCFNTLLAPEIHPEEWLTIYPDGYLKNDLVWSIEKNKISIEQNGLFEGRMGVVVFLFHYAAISKDDFYENMALDLLSVIMSQINIQSSIDYEDGLSGIGCAVEYLHKNGFIGGDINDILYDFDLFFDDVLSSENNRIKLQDNLLGLIRYYRFRLSGKSFDINSERTKKNKTNLSYLLTILEKTMSVIAYNKEEIISELYELNFLEDFFTHVDRLLESYFSSSIYSKEERMMLAEKISRERVSGIEYGDKPGLRGLAGKELSMLVANSTFEWTKLL